MGIRPQIKLVFGIDNFTQESVWNEFSEAEIYHNNDYYIKGFLFDDKESVWLYDVLHCSDNVLGMIINNSDADSDMLRALSLFYPEFSEGGKLDIPVQEKEKHYLYARRIENNIPKCEDIQFEWQWFYSSVLESHSMWPVYAYCTRWLFKQVGIEIDYKQFKAMLVWDWS